MKRSCLILMLSALWIALCGEVYNVRFVDSQSGCKYVDTRVNGVAVRFLFDTGCSDVMLTPAVWRRLKRAGVASDADLSDAVSSTVADGRKQEGHSFIIREMTIGGCVFRNVRADVAKISGDADCLLGQSLLSHMNYYTVRGNVLEFEPKTSRLSDADNAGLDAGGIVEVLEPIYLNGGLDQLYLVKYAEALREVGRYSDAVECYAQLMDTTRYTQHPSYREAWLYAQLSHTNRLVEKGQYKEVIDYCLQRVSNRSFIADSVGQQVALEMKYNMFIAYLYMNEMALAALYGTMYTDAILTENYGITTSDLQHKRINCTDEMVENVLKNLKAAYSNIRDFKRRDYYGRLLRHAGF